MLGPDSQRQSKLSLSGTSISAVRESEKYIVNLKIINLELSSYLSMIIECWQYNMVITRTAIFIQNGRLLTAVVIYS